MSFLSKIHLINQSSKVEDEPFYRQSQLFVNGNNPQDEEIDQADAVVCFICISPLQFLNFSLHFL